MMQNIKNRLLCAARAVFGGAAGAARAGVLLIPLIAMAPATLCAQQTWTLDSILARIRTGNPGLQSYEYKVEAMHAYAEGAKSWMSPMLGAGTFMTPYPGRKPQGDKGMWMLAAEQAIPGLGKLRAKEDYMGSKAAVEQASLGVAFNQLRAEAKSLYYQWVVLEKKKTVLEESLQIMQTMLKLAEIRYPYNQGSLGSIYKARGRLHEVENQLLVNDRERVEKNILLNSLMNIPRGTRYSIDTSIQDFSDRPALVDSAYLLQNRSDLRRIGRRIESMQLGAELEKLERRPDFSLRLEHMQPYGGGMPARYTLMGMVSIPIAPWASKMYKSNVKGMQLEIKAMEMEREAVLNETRGMIAGLSLEIQTMEQQLRNYTGKIIPALRKNYETTLLAYEQNQEQLPMVIDAWEALNMANMEYLDKLEAWYLMIVRYEKELEK